MLLFYFLRNKYLWIVAWVLQSIGYHSVLKRIGDNPDFSIVPFFAEWRLSKYVFSRNVTFFRPLIITLVLVLAGFYLNPLQGRGFLFICIAAIIYFFFLLRLYRRLAKGYGKRWWYNIFMFFFPPLFLFLLGKTKRYFSGPTFKIRKHLTRWLRRLGYAFTVLLCVAEIVAITLGVGIITIRRQQPRFLANRILKDTENKTKDVVGDGELTSREEALGSNASIIASAEHSRDYFFPDHSKDRNVVVLEYIIGSNLENAAGLASANITQIKDATTRGENMVFVMQTGGSSRWFTDGIEENGNGRYLVEDGKVTQIERLDDSLCMSEQKSLEDFLVWGRQNYPADRYILVLWDHGGGFSLGYGVDDLNKKQGNSTMLVNEMIEAIGNSGMKFDIIGFDACLMQNIETALAFEPYADFFIASEEVEGGFGWFYTSAFAKLAENPGIPSLDFASELISAYDVYNTALHDGEIDTGATLSVVDLTMIRPAYEKLQELFVISNEAILEDPEYYADVSVSASKAYGFQNEEQIDLISYLKILDSVDYESSICKDNACLMTADSIIAAIPYRNKNSADGIHGMSLTFPIRSITSYEAVYEQLKAFDMNDEMEFLNNFFSIMAAQSDKYDSVTNQEWYVEGFEDYETTDAYIDIPLTETEFGYRIDLPEKIRNIISDIQVAAYQKEGDRLRYLGRDYVGVYDDGEKDYIDMDNSWVHINNNLICYETEQTKETDYGTIYSGTTRALLNGEDEIIIHIEWNPVNERTMGLPTGKITGFTYVDEFKAFMSKGLHEFKSGDRLNFYFDYYDLQGNFINTETYGSTLYVTNPDYLVVKDKELKKCDIIFSGVLTDVYQREFLTEQIEYHID